MLLQPREWMEGARDQPIGTPVLLLESDWVWLLAFVESTIVFGSPGLPYMQSYKPIKCFIL